MERREFLCKQASSGCLEQSYIDVIPIWTNREPPGITGVDKNTQTIPEEALENGP
jgi:hypothetical protein